VSSLLQNLSERAAEGGFWFQLRLVGQAPQAVAWAKLAETGGFSVDFACAMLVGLQTKAGKGAEAEAAVEAPSGLVYLLALGLQHAFGGIAGMTALESNLAILSILKVHYKALPFPYQPNPPHSQPSSCSSCQSQLIHPPTIVHVPMHSSVIFQRDSVQASVLALLASDASLDPRGLLATFTRHAPHEDNALEQARWATWLVGQHRKRMSYDFVRGEAHEAVFQFSFFRFFVCSFNQTGVYCFDSSPQCGRFWRRVETSTVMGAGKRCLR